MKEVSDIIPYRSKEISKLNWEGGSPDKGVSCGIYEGCERFVGRCDMSVLNTCRIVIVTACLSIMNAYYTFNGAESSPRIKFRIKFRF